MLDTLSHFGGVTIKAATCCGVDCSSKNVLQWVKQNSKEFVETSLVYSGLLQR
jgi:hypothetical protein